MHVCIALYLTLLYIINISSLASLVWMHLRGQDQATMLTSSDIDLRPCNGSALRLFLPDGLILRLMSEVLFPTTYKVVKGHAIFEFCLALKNGVVMMLANTLAHFVVHLCGMLGMLSLNVCCPGSHKSNILD